MNRPETPRLRLRARARPSYAMDSDHRISLEVLAHLDVARIIELESLPLRRAPLWAWALKPPINWPSRRCTLSTAPPAHLHRLRAENRAHSPEHGPGLDMLVSDEVTLSGEYQGQLLENVQTHGGRIGLEIAF